MKMIVGLGNPGKQYAGTRHNMGYEVIGLMARQYCADRPKGKFQSEYVEISINGTKVILLSPLTYMNRSGSAVAQARGFYKMEISDILVVCDDINLPVGKIRCRPTGSAGGQKGLGDIIRCLGTEDVPRLRLGIGSPVEGISLPDFVLSEFSREEKSEINNSVARAAKAAVTWVTEGVSACMNQYN